MDVDYNRLRVFFHVYDAGGVSRAAAALGVTQSAVSQSLAKLEEEVGAQLFVRRHRALVPTPAADALFQVVAPFVDALRGGIDRIHQQRHELVGTLRLGAPVEFGAHRLTPILAAFSAEHPQIRFTLTLGHPSQIVPALEQGRLDVAFADLYEDDRRGPPSGLQVLGVMDEALVLVASPDHERRALGGSRSWTRLSAARFVAYGPQASALRGWFRHHLRRVPSRLDVALVVESVQAVLTAAEHGMGLGLVPSHTAQRSVDAGRLVVVGTRRRPLTNRISLVRLLDKVPSRAERTLVTFLLDQLGAHERRFRDGPENPAGPR